MRFQHNNCQIDLETYAYVQEYKRQLLSKVSKVLNDNNISFTIAHGNLIEFERGENIYHDDDIDIRFDINDIKKWEKYCNLLINNKDKENNLNLDDRCKDISSQLYNGIQIKLIKFENNLYIKEFPLLDLHLDLVPSSVGINKEEDIWPDYDINYKNLRKITYLGIDTFAPCYDDTHRVLSKQYGKNYIIPEIEYLKPPWKNDKDINRIITFGTYDLFHHGHLNILKRAKNIFKNTELVVGISSDIFNFRKKTKYPIISQENRKKIIESLEFVDECFFEESLEYKLKYCIDYNIDMLVMGDDHKGKFDFLKIYGIHTHYFPRTQDISTSDIIEKIISNNEQDPTKKKK